MFIRVGERADRTFGTDSAKQSAETTHRRSNPRTQRMSVSARIALRSSEADACELEVCHKSQFSRLQCLDHRRMETIIRATNLRVGDDLLGLSRAR